MLFSEKFDLEAPDYIPEPLGNCAAIVRILTQLLPTFQYFSDGWGILKEANFSIEFNIGKEEITDCIMMSIRGGGDPMPIIKTICDATKWGAFDTSAAAFVDVENLSPESWINFQAFRDKVISRN